MKRWAQVLGSVGAMVSVAFVAVAADPLGKVGRDQLCVTDGDIAAGPGDTLSVTTPAMRAVVPASSRQDVEVRFAFLGPTDRTVALGSGAVREQFGLKLRAADPCNLVYAMWRFAPKPGVVVQLKRNPGASDSQTCRNHGYSDVKPSFARAMGAPDVGRTYWLRAEMEARTLKVSLDGDVVWQGDVDDAPPGGPVGVRSDNAKLAMTLFAPIGPATAGAPPHCRGGGEE